ncbi:MAG: tyrosine--tRNA ligase, partial [Kiritimatiellaeota bacterium]|nr:tyrosine--tRNA ligase [Kiritimatiellota bacterium]
QGRKFGKSEGNAIYLDSRKTSYYDFYQFFLRTEDVDVCRYLRIFTFLPLEGIAALEETVKSQPEKREAQRILAEDLTRRVHGETGLAIAQKATAVLFGGAMTGLSANDLLSIFKDVPSCTLPREAVTGKTVIDLAAASGLCKSKGEARRLADNGGLYLNNEKVAAADLVTDDRIIDNQALILRAGKKTYCVVKV